MQKLKLFADFVSVKQEKAKGMESIDIADAETMNSIQSMNRDVLEGREKPYDGRVIMHSLISSKKVDCYLSSKYNRFYWVVISIQMRGRLK